MAEWFALIDLETSQVRNPVAGAQSLRTWGAELQDGEGRSYEKLSRNLASFATDLFSYQPVLAEALAPVIGRWGAQPIRALARIWPIEAAEHRHPLPLAEQQARRKLWADSPAEAVTAPIELPITQEDDRGFCGHHGLHLGY